MDKRVKIIVLLLLFAVSAFAQRWAELDRLNQQIITARELLRVFPNQQAEHFVQQAETLRDEARNLFRQQRMVLAFEKLTSARHFIDDAINMLSQVPVERIREQVDELIRNAEQLLNSKNNQEAERLLRNARENRMAAGNSLSRNESRKAMEQFRIAKFYAERSINLLQGQTGNIEETLKSEQARYEELLRQAESTVANCFNEQAKNLVGSVKEQYPNIERARQNGNNQVVLNMYYSNTRLLLRAIDLCQGQDISVQEQAIEEVELLGELLQSVGEQGGNGQNTRNNLIVQRATRLHQQAVNALQTQNFNKATRNATMGRTLLSRLWGGNNRDSIEQKTEEELEQLTDDVERIRTDSGIMDDPQKKALLQAAENSLEDARQFLQKGKVRLALESIYAGNRYLSAITRSTTSVMDLNTQKINDDLNRLREALAQLQNNANMDENTAALLTEAQKMLNNAARALEQNQLQLARENIDLGFDLVEKIKK